MDEEDLLFQHKIIVYGGPHRLSMLPTRLGVLWERDEPSEDEDFSSPIILPRIGYPNPFDAGDSSIPPIAMPPSPLLPPLEEVMQLPSPLFSPVLSTFQPQPHDLNETSILRTSVENKHLEVTVTTGASQTTTVGSSKSAVWPSDLIFPNPLELETLVSPPAPPSTPSYPSELSEDQYLCHWDNENIEISMTAPHTIDTASLIRALHSVFIEMSCGQRAEADGGVTPPLSGQSTPNEVCQPSDISSLPVTPDESNPAIDMSGPFSASLNPQAETNNCGSKSAAWRPTLVRRPARYQASGRWERGENYSYKEYDHHYYRF